MKVRVKNPPTAARRAGCKPVCSTRSCSVLPQAEQLLPRTDPLPRKQATAALAKLYVKRKDFAQAEALLTRLADEDHYPFGVVTDLLLAIAKGLPRTLDRVLASAEELSAARPESSTPPRRFPDHASSILASSAARHCARHG
jgi:hypothetical protein